MAHKCLKESFSGRYSSVFPIWGIIILLESVLWGFSWNSVFRLRQHFHKATEKQQRGCPWSGDNLKYKRASTARSSRVFYNSRQVAGGRGCYNPMLGHGNTPQKRTCARKPGYLSLQVRGKQENHVWRKKSMEFGLLNLEEKEGKYNNTQFNTQ